MGDFFIFQVPNVFAEFGVVFLFFVLERCFVSCVSFFESRSCQTYVRFFLIGGGYFCFVYEVLGRAFAWEGAVVLISAVAGVLGISWLAVDYFAVVGLYRFFHVVRTAVTYLEGVSITNFV